MSDKTTDAENVPVSSTDELVDTGDSQTDHLRKFGEYRSSNAPLSALEREKRSGHWVPLALKDIGDLEPVPEKPAKKE